MWKIAAFLTTNAMKIINETAFEETLKTFSIWIILTTGLKAPPLLLPCR